MPAWRDFLAGAATKLLPDAEAEVLTALREERLADAATKIKSELRSGWITLLRREFVVSRTAAVERELERLRLVWQVARGLVITTNYDETLQWGRNGTDPIPEIYGLESTPDLSAIINASEKHPVLWHLHGRITYPESIVIESASYQALYRADESPDAARRHRAAFMCLRTVAATRSFLFLGFSLTDPSVNKVLVDVRELFGEPHEHFLVCLEAEEAQTRKRLDAQGLDHVTLLPVADYHDALDELLNELWQKSTPSTQLHLTAPAWIRRRCRSIVAGPPDFQERLRPLIAEHAPVDAVVLLGELLEDEGLSDFESAIARALRHELSGRIEPMLRATTAGLARLGDDTVERLNLMLFHAIALEKLGGDHLVEAINHLDHIVQHAASPAELRMSAEFNRDVCREKLDDPNVTFDRYIAMRDFRFSSGELIWTKGFNMELVRCGRREIDFGYAHLLNDAIDAELAEASTGFGKTITNWGHFAQAPIEGLALERLNEIASRATPTQRIPMLAYIESISPDKHLRDAINDALERSGHSGVLRRLIQTRRLHGRYTLYGEYLMHATAPGYLAPTPMYLQGAPGSAGFRQWSAENDSMRRLVSRLGLDVLDHVSGDLPLGHGFASSTVLLLLHLREQVSNEVRSNILTVFDWVSHGFQPSGADQAAILAQQPGFYFRDTWRRASDVAVNGAFVVARGESTMPLGKVKTLMSSVHGRLTPIAEALRRSIDRHGALDLNAFDDYCGVLAHAAIYTRQQREVVDLARSLDLPAKAIGGLHNKAILVVGSDTQLDRLVAGLPDHSAVVGRLRDRSGAAQVTS